MSHSQETAHRRRSMAGEGVIAMAQLRKRHVLQGVTRRVGEHLRLDRQEDGTTRVQATNEGGLLASPHWETFREAVAYGLQNQGDVTYQAIAAARHTSPFKVATADFLHVPEIDAVDVSDYHGQVGDVIRVSAHDDVMIAEVGVLIVDPQNRPIEMGKATQYGAEWVYCAQNTARAHHVRIIVDAADLPGNLGEKRVEKDL